MAARDLALIAVFAGFIAALALPGAFFVPGSGVPITAQTLGVMLAGCVLGARRAALAVLAFVVLVAAGLPVLATGAAGLGVFASQRGGFIIGWIAGAWVIGLMVQLWHGRFALGWGILANIVGGIVVVYAFGIPMMAYRAHLTVPQTVTAMWVYVPGDLAKAVIAAVVARAVYRGYPAVARQLGRTEQAVR
jgi:biotin transport system substrate-specific component